MFFVASADPELASGPDGTGPVNVSPKGGVVLHILDRNRVAYLDYRGSGNEPARHCSAGGPITVMVCSFEEQDAAVVRLFGTARATALADSPLAQLLRAHPGGGGERTGAAGDRDSRRKDGDSCGYGVPVMQFVRQRRIANRGRRYKQANAPRVAVSTCENTGGARQMSGVYEGLTVVELADRRNQWAGKLLSDGGARVIQIEPSRGSPGRWCGPFVDDKVDPDRCLDYWWYNTGKQSVALDVSRQPGQDLLRRLLARADVFLESTAPGTLAAHGLDYASVASNRALIYASLTDFGQDGPWRDYQMNEPRTWRSVATWRASGYSDPKATPIGGQGHQAWHMGCAFALHGITSRSSTA